MNENSYTSKTMKSKVLAEKSAACVLLQALNVIDENVRNVIISLSLFNFSILYLLDETNLRHSSFIPNNNFKVTNCSWNET